MGPDSKNDHADEDQQHFIALMPQMISCTVISKKDNSFWKITVIYLIKKYTAIKGIQTGMPLFV
jgi:hypothetical protein